MRALQYQYATVGNVITGQAGGATIRWGDNATTYRYLLRWPRTGAGQALVECGRGLCHRFVENSHLPVRRLLLGKDEEGAETYHHELFFRFQHQRGKIVKYKQNKKPSRTRCVRYGSSNKNNTYCQMTIRRQLMLCMFLHNKQKPWHARSKWQHTQLENLRCDLKQIDFAAAVAFLSF